MIGWITHHHFLGKVKLSSYRDDIEFIKSRVGDGKFNNSGFVEGRYDYLIIYDVVDDRNKLKRVSDKEVMLYRKDAPMIKVNSVNKIGIMDKESYND